MVCQGAVEVGAAFGVGVDGDGDAVGYEELYVLSFSLSVLLTCLCSVAVQTRGGGHDSSPLPRA